MLHLKRIGEHGIYLHAAPYMMAPKAQKHVPTIAWTGNNFDYSLNDIKPYKDFALSHDELFCTLLVTYELESKMCSYISKE